MTTKPDPELQRLARLVGTWSAEGTHPAVPGVALRGTMTAEWLEGERFLVLRSRVDHPAFPKDLCIIGRTGSDRAAEGGDAEPGAGRLTMHYYDSRGVFRLNDTSIDDEAWRWWREAPGFSQRFTATFADGGNTMIGRSQLRRDDVHWVDDLELTYRRQR